METRVLLFVQEGSAKQKYLEALNDCGVQVFVASTFYDLSEDICSHTYHGLLLDLPTKMKAIRKSKLYVYQLVEKFPVAHLLIDNRTGKIGCCRFNNKSCSSLLDFINYQCRNSVPQRIREEARKDLYLSVCLYKKKDDIRPERSVTKNISSGGCFVISTRRRKVGSDIWLQFAEMQDSDLIQAQIRSVVKWGEGRRVPGLGLEFKDLSRSQVESLAEMLS